MDLLAKLAELGFTEYEAKVYLALLDDYPASGYQISKTAGVPRSMVYEALGRLKLRGAVLETPDEPRHALPAAAAGRPAGQPRAGSAPAGERAARRAGRPVSDARGGSHLVDPRARGAAGLRP
ncbi:MAG: helix-turn-helix domain-containing protein [Anaerolineae bacterium]